MRKTLMSPKLHDHLARIGISTEPPPSLFRTLVSILFWISLVVLTTQHFAPTPHSAIVVALAVVSAMLTLGAAARYRLLTQVRELSKSSHPRHRAAYIRVIFSFVGNAMFFAPTRRIVAHHLSTLVIAGILISGQHYLAMAALVVSIYATDRLFHENVDFVIAYQDMVERYEHAPSVIG